MFEDIINPNEQVTKADNRVSAQIASGKEVFDVKVDLLQYMRQSVFVERNKVKITHKFHFEDIGEQDCLLLQVPNINESGYYAGIVALKSWVNKYAPEFKVAIIDPVIDYFYINPPDKKSDFFNLFNTYSKQSQFHLFYNHSEIFDIAYGFIGRYLEKTKAKLLGFSIIDGNIDATLAIAKLIKEKYPDIKILVGGNGVECLEFGRLPNANYRVNDYWFIDTINRGDGEYTFVELLKSDWSEESLMNIKGLVWRLNGVWIHNPMRANIDMNELPVPDYSELEDNYYYKSVYQDTVPLVMSRGCPYRCSFCSVPDYIPEYRFRTTDNVIQEIESWLAKGKKHFFCHDSIINGNPNWLKEFCEKIIAKGYDITFGGNMRLQQPMRDLDTMRLYRKAGLTKMITGFESASEPVLRHMKKYSNMEGTKEIFENVRIVNKECAAEGKIPLMFGMQLIIGYLNEGEEDFQKTMDFVEEYHDCMDEIITCSAFLIHEPLRIRWSEVDKQYLEYINGVNFSTKWNTPMDRLERLDRIEQLFIKIGIPYSIYNRGLYAELKEELKKKKEYNHTL
ncbi:MAG: radical SAM protein [Pelagibacterales bacterium]|nr:radical SAM protein [Pelagibacterales bacterium]